MGKLLEKPLMMKKLKLYLLKMDLEKKKNKVKNDNHIDNLIKKFLNN
jgi:hypothetical protein